MGLSRDQVPAVRRFYDALGQSEHQAWDDDELEDRFLGNAPDVECLYVWADDALAPVPIVIRGCQGAYFAYVTESGYTETFSTREEARDDLIKSWEGDIIGATEDEVLRQARDCGYI